MDRAGVPLTLGSAPAGGRGRARQRAAGRQCPGWRGLTRTHWGRLCSHPRVPEEGAEEAAGTRGRVQAPVRQEQAPLCWRLPQDVVQAPGGRCYCCSVFGKGWSTPSLASHPPHVGATGRAEHFPLSSAETRPEGQGPGKGLVSTKGAVLSSQGGRGGGGGMKTSTTNSAPPPHPAHRLRPRTTIPFTGILQPNHLM